MNVDPEVIAAAIAELRAREQQALEQSQALEAQAFAEATSQPSGDKDK